MPIRLPPTEKFPDEKGVVYVAGWGANHESSQEEGCTTNDKGPAPFSKCKFPFYIGNMGTAFGQCIKTESPSAKNRDCKKLYKMIIKNNATSTFLDKYRVNTDICTFLVHL